jgi:hypothetical protein
VVQTQAQAFTTASASELATSTSSAGGVSETVLSIVPPKATTVGSGGNGCTAATMTVTETVTARETVTVRG